VQQNLSPNEVIIYNKAPENTLKTASASEQPKDKRAYSITSTALKFKGTKYKYGGTTENGMDCSGLVFTSFLEENIELPRSSRGMSLEGERLSLVDVNIGDLLFFETNKKKKVINHVGLVVEIQPGHILFIHSSTSRGVIISSLADDYWFEHFVMARRVI
jgi:cell wall-associated NlpC family hydrolase